MKKASETRGTARCAGCLFGRVLITIGALGVGVLTMPVWPFLVAAMVWNDFDAED